MTAKILVVDDAQFMRLRYQKLLTSEGYQVVEAADGREALDVYDREKPVMVFRDITMPVMDGIEALTELRKRHDDAVIVMSSAPGQESMIIAAIKGGAKDFIVKPFQSENILNTVRKIVG